MNNIFNKFNMNSIERGGRIEREIFPLESGETSLDRKKANASIDYNAVVEEFGMENSPTFISSMEQMKGMDHGPNHKEGDPFVHSQLAVHELVTRINESETGLSESDLRVLRLSVLLHDVGKAYTQKYDVVSGEQNKIVGASEESISKADAWKRSIIQEISGVPTEGLSKNEIRKLLEKHEDDVQKIINERRKDLGDDSVAVVANYRGHEKKSAEMIDKIFEESGVELTDTEREDVRFLIDNHMELFKIGKMDIKQFKALIAQSGEIDSRRLEMLRLHTQADNAATLGADALSKDQSLDEAVAMKVTEFKVILQKEQKEQEIAERIEKIFGGKIAQYLQSRGVVPGPQLGKMQKEWQALTVKMLTEKPETTNEEVRAVFDNLEIK